MTYKAHTEDAALFGAVSARASLVPQAPEGHRCDSPSVEPRFRGGAQRLGMRTAPFNLRGRAFHALSLTDGARCRVKPRSTPSQPVARRRGFLPVELGRAAGNGCAPLFVENSL
jgi:hypothetical protein